MLSSWAYWRRIMVALLPLGTWDQVRFRPNKSATCISFSGSSSHSRTARRRIDSPAKKIFTIGVCLNTADSAAAVETVYRSDWGRIVATLIRLVGDFEVAEEAAQEAFAAAVDQWRADGVPEYPRAWIIQTARHKAIDRIRRQALRRKAGVLRGPGSHRAVDGARLRQQRDPRRPAAADLHLLPSGAGARGAGGADAAHARRPGNRRDRAGVSGAGSDHGAAAGARQAQDSRRRHSLRGAGSQATCASGWMRC